jgi:hypothetical protein
MNHVYNLQHHALVLVGVMKRQRLAGGRNIVTRFVQGMEDAEGFQLLRQLSDVQVAGILRYLMPLELVGVRRVSKSVALVPSDWFRDAKLPLPAPPQRIDDMKSTDTLSACTDVIRERLDARGLRLGSQLTAGMWGTIFQVCAKDQPLECSDYILKRMARTEKTTENDLRVHKHLSRLVPNCVPILYDTWPCDDGAGARRGRTYILMQRLGKTLLELRVERQLAGASNLEASNWMTAEETKALIATVQRVSFEGDVYHGDLHAGNVVERIDGVGWKLIDFGSSTLWDDMKTVDDMLATIFGRTKPMPSNHKLRADAEYLYANRRWFGVLALFEGGGWEPILWSSDAAIAVPAPFLAAVARVQWSDADSDSAMTDDDSVMSDW